MKIKFSIPEIKHITIALVTLSFAFSFILYSQEIFLDTGFFYQLNFLTDSLFVVGIAFILHELGHKFVAQKYGLWAEFRAWPTGLFLAVAMAIISKGSFVFAAPGAVMISSKRKITRLTKKHISKFGKISLAGPITNIILAVIFTILFIITNMQLMQLATQINLILAMFNLLPFSVLDGYKIFYWNKKAWAGAVSAVIILLFLI